MYIYIILCKPLGFFVYRNTHAFLKFGVHLFWSFFKRWEVNTYLVDNHRQPPGPTQTEHKYIYTLLNPTTLSNNKSETLSSGDRYFFFQVRRFVYFMLVSISRKWKNIEFFIWFNLEYKPKGILYTCIIVRIKWSGFSFVVFFVNYIR